MIASSGDILKGMRFSWTLGVFIILFSVFGASLAFAQVEPVPYTATSFGFRVGMFWQGQSEDTTTTNGVETSPLLQNVGFSFRLPLSSLVSFEPGFDFFYDEYAYIESLSRAVPTQMETGSVSGALARVLGMAIRLPFGFHLGLSPRTSLILRPGITALLRLPVAGLDGTTLEETGTISSDLNGGGRFLYPEFELGVGTQVSEKAGFDFGLRVLFPLWHAWDPREIPFWDSLFVWGSVGFRLFL